MTGASLHVPWVVETLGSGVAIRAEQPEPHLIWWPKERACDYAGIPTQRQDRAVDPMSSHRANVDQCLSAHKCPASPSYVLAALLLLGHAQISYLFSAFGISIFDMVIVSPFSSPVRSTV